MKKKLKKALISIFLSIVCGAICGKLVYGIYDKKIADDLTGERIYLIQSGAYSSYDSMVSNVLMSNYVYYEDTDGLYKSIIALTEDYNNIEKIKNTYSDNVLITEYYSKDNELNQKIKEYDLQLKMATDKEQIQEIIEKMLALYKDKNTTLTQITS